MGKNQRLKVHRQWLPGRSLCSIRSNRKWCKRRGSSLECQNCFFVYPIIDSNLKNLLLKSYHILKHISIPIVSAPIYCIAFRRKCVSFCFLFIIFSIIIYFLSFLCPTERGLLLSLPGVYRHADNASVNMGFETFFG